MVKIDSRMNKKSWGNKPRFNFTKDKNIAILSKKTYREFKMRYKKREWVYLN